MKWKGSLRQALFKNYQKSKMVTDGTIQEWYKDLRVEPEHRIFHNLFGLLSPEPNKRKEKECASYLRQQEYDYKMTWLQGGGLSRLRANSNGPINFLATFIQFGKGTF